MSQVWLPHGVSVWGALGLSYEVTEKHGEVQDVMCGGRQKCFGAAA